MLSRAMADIPLVVTEPTQVKFYYDHKTHWIADDFNKQIVVASGDFQKQIGCFNDYDATCLRAWLQDPDGDGLYDVTTAGINAGTYTVTFTRNENAGNIIGEPQQFTVEKDGNAVYFGYDSVKNEFTISTTGAPVGNLTKQRAIWIDKDTILWKIGGGSGLKYALIYSSEAALTLSPDGILNGTEVPLTFVSDKPDVEILRDYPHLRDYAVLRVTGTSNIAEILKGQVAVVARSQAGRDVDATGVQFPGALDDLFQYNGPLGVTFDGAVPSLRVWAPTAQAVTLFMYDTEKAS
jgi:pullulanase